MLDLSKRKVLLRGGEREREWERERRGGFCFAMTEQELISGI